jgi:hypothetical protein
VVVDLSADLEQALAAPYLPVVPGQRIAVLLATVDDLLKVIQMTDRNLDHLQVFFADEGGFAAGINKAIASFGRSVSAVKVYSTRSQREVSAATDVGGRDIPVQVEGDLTVSQILLNLGAVSGPAMRFLMQLYEGAKSLVQFL